MMPGSSLISPFSMGRLAFKMEPLQASDSFRRGMLRFVLRTKKERRQAITRMGFGLSSIKMCYVNSFGHAGIL